MIVPDYLMKRLLELLDVNDVILAAHEDEDEEIEDHRNRIKQVKHEIEEGACSSGV